MNKLVSIVVPIFNTEKYLTSCINSILEQTYTNFECILVNDGSTDGSLAICNSAVEHDARFRVINKPNGGLSDARNAGLDAARGDYISFIDSDDWVDPDFISFLLKGLTYNSADMATCARINHYGEKSFPQYVTKPTNMSSEELVRSVLCDELADVAACDKLYRSSMFQDIRFPIGEISEDIAVFFKLAAKTKRVHLTGVPLYHYRHRPGSITTTSSFSKRNADVIKTFDILRSELLLKYPNLTSQIDRYCIKGYSNVLAVALCAERDGFTSDFIKETKRRLLRELPTIVSNNSFSKYDRAIIFCQLTGIYVLLKNIRRTIKGR